MGSNTGPRYSGPEYLIVGSRSQKGGSVLRFRPCVGTIRHLRADSRSRCGDESPRRNEKSPNPARLRLLIIDRSFRHLTSVKLSNSAFRVNGETKVFPIETLCARPNQRAAMFTHDIKEAVARARSIAAVDDLMRSLWGAHGAGQITDNDAEALAEAAEARRIVLRTPTAPNAIKPASARRRPPRSPDRQRSIERRRQLATCGTVPSRIAAQFTQGETAVLAVIGRQVKAQGRCQMPLDRIAALAGVSRTTAQNAIRHAKRLGLIAVHERRLTAWRNDTNLIAITSHDWIAWLDRGNALQSRGRVQNVERHVIRRFKIGLSDKKTEGGSSIAGPRHAVTGQKGACG